MKKYVIDVEYKRAIPTDEFIEYVEESLEEGVYDRLFKDYLSERSVSAYDVFLWNNKDKKDFLSQFANSLMTGYEEDLFFVVEIEG